MFFLLLIESDNWYHLKWFLPQTWQSYAWQSPLWLLGIPFLLFLPIFRWIFSLRNKEKVPFVIPAPYKELQDKVWLRFVPDVIMFLVKSLILVALARPQIVSQKVEKYAEGIDIIIAVDVSESMLYEDYYPNRLQASLQTAQRFIDDRLYEDRIGLVVFSGEAFTLVPLTTDYEVLKNYLSEEVTENMTESEGTALGDALVVAINRLEESKAKSKVIILLSDGDSNAGRIQALEAAQIAKEKQIKVYSIIAASKQKQVAYGKDATGKPILYENAIDEATMQSIAQMTKGEFFRADEQGMLAKIFQKISTYEKSETLEVRFSEAKDYYRIYLLWAVVFWFVWLLLKNTFMNNALED